MLALIIELHCRPTCFYRFVPFAGFFSCEAGMPLIANRQAVNDKEFRVSFTVKDKSTLKDMPKKCPEGFNAMLAHVNLGCVVYYCIYLGAVPGPINPKIKRPPFMEAPAFPDPVGGGLTVFNPMTNTWTRAEKNRGTTFSTASNRLVTVQAVFFYIFVRVM